MYTGQRGYLHNVQLEWHNGYWDGPISGVASIDGYKVYFQQFGDDRWVKYYDPECDTPDLNEGEEEPGIAYDITRDYYAYDLPEATMKLLEQNQALWEQHVSNGNRYINNSRVFLTPNHKIGTGTCDSYEAARVAVTVIPELVFRNRIGYFDSNTLWHSRHAH